MSSPSQRIRHRLTVELVGPRGAASLEAELRYDTADPYAVVISFQRGAEEVDWVFGRDLLLRGVSEPAGDGDVKVLPSLDADGRAVVVVSLAAPSGQALVEMRTRELLEFLAMTTRLVWPGTEREHQVGTDEAIAAILVGD